MNCRSRRRREFVSCAPGVDKLGRRLFVASGAGYQQLHLFDPQWNLLQSFPDHDHAGIADVQLANLSADGEVILAVGYLGVVGVQGVSLEGERLWSNRSIENVWQLALTDPDADGRRKILAVNSRGTLVPISDRGENEPDIHVPGRAVVNLVAEDVNGDDHRELCPALAAIGLGRNAAIGIDTNGKELWQYELPPGVHKEPIERIIPARLAGGEGGGWLLPAADGSIHLLGSDGRLIDRFHHGSELTGLAITQIGDQTILLISSLDGFTAWKVEASKE